MTDYVPYLGDILSGIASADSAQRKETWDRLLLIGAQAAWDAAKDPLHDELQAAIGRADMIASGVSLYGIDLRLAKDVSLTRAAGASSTTGGIPLELRIGPNLLQATSTTPSVFGSYADPRFSVDFGVVVDFSLLVAPEHMSISLQIGAAHVTGADFTGNPHFDSQNAVGDIMKFIGDTLIPWFGGPNYVAMLESLIGQRDFADALNRALQPVNDRLGDLAKEGMGSIIALFPDAAAPAGLSPQALSLAGPPSDAAPLLIVAQPVLGDGIVEGSIHWPREAGAPSLDPPFDGAFSLSASVDRGAASGAFSQATDVTHLSRWQYLPTDAEHVIGYTLGGLPIDEPISVACTANAGTAWNGAAQDKVVSPQPDHWAGPVTVRPGAHVFQRYGEQSAQRAGEEVELNPQPIPPGHLIPVGQEVHRLDPGAEVELNPQPIPPGIGGARGAMRTGPPTNVVGEVGTHLGGGEESPIRISEFTREDPTGEGRVEGIDFVVHFLERPR